MGSAAATNEALLIKYWQSKASIGCEVFIVLLPFVNNVRFSSLLERNPDKQKGSKGQHEALGLSSDCYKGHPSARKHWSQSSVRRGHNIFH